MPNDPTKTDAPQDPDDVALPDTSDPLPPLDFTTFILSLSTSVLVSLGEIPGPDGEAGLDLPLARQTIDIIGMLRDKTRGNLSGEEERLLEQVLLDLRMKFVHAAGGKKPR
jgi:hypothetical protein